MSKLPLPLKIYLVALVLRLIPVLLTADLPIGLDDMFQYDMLGRSLAEGNGLRWYAQDDLDLISQHIDFDLVVGDYDPQGIPASFRGPGYPALLALIYTVSGYVSRFFAARLVQVFLGASIAPLAYGITRLLFPGSKRAGVIAGLSMALYPMLVIYPLALATENLFIPLTSLGIWLLLLAHEKDSLGLYAIAGLALGAATLTRSVIFAFAGLALLWVWWASRKWQAALLYLLTLIIVVTPWAVRNSQLHGKPTFVETSLGYNLYLGYHPEGTGTFQYGISLDLLPYLDDKERDERGMLAAMEFIRADPGRTPELILNKASYFMGLEERALSYFYSNGFFGAIPTSLLVGIFVLFAMPFTILATLAAIGIGLSNWTKNKWLLVGALVAYTLPHLLIMAEARFHLAIVPILAAFAGQAVESRNGLRQRVKQFPWVAGMVILVIAALWLNWSWELSRDADKLRTLFGPDGFRSYFSY